MFNKLLEIYKEVGFIRLTYRITSKIKSLILNFCNQFKDTIFQTYSYERIDKALYDWELNFNFNLPAIENYDIPEFVITNYLNHKFDLLGSGWVEVKYGLNCNGVEGFKYANSVIPNIDHNGSWLKERINNSNINESIKIWKNIDINYKPIDWQLDFKSGYRWNENQYYKKIKIGILEGVDIKVPWELSRMQHLPQLALAFHSDNFSKETKDKIKKEFRNQILDFISTNPPRYGVNWVCAMDVAIRASNMILAFQILNQKEYLFDEKFVSIFQRSIEDHGKFITENLEWNNGKRGNHYLSNICGLVIISLFLPSTNITNKWLIFSIKELITEVNFQFLNDGGNFEYSTAYHRLSMEMIFYATAYIINIPNSKLVDLIKNNKKLKYLDLIDNCKNENNLIFTNQYFEKLEKISKFILDIVKPRNKIPQLGDNDSGRFFKLNPKYSLIPNVDFIKQYSNFQMYELNNDYKFYYLENNLDALSVISISSAFFPDLLKNFLGYKVNILESPDFLLIKSLIENKIHKLKTTTNNSKLIGNENIFLNYIKKINNSNFKFDIFEYKSNFNFENLNLLSYEDFGLFIFKKNNFYLSTRCYTKIHKFSPLGHIHEDQLSIELSIDNDDFILDPGTYLYTSLPSERNIYRSSISHFSPLKISSIELKDKNVFKRIKIPLAKIIYFGRSGIIIETIENFEKYGLIVEFKDYKIRIYFLYFNNQNSKKINKIPYSPGYGIKMQLN